MNAPLRYPRPALLAQIPAGGAVLEASAGTGKTWTLEHLVLDLLLTQGLRLEEILVVTFGEKAAREMRERIRSKIQELLEGGFQQAAEGDPHWLLDAPARAALDQALMGFDRASISTIHAFCQRLLNETALLAGRPFQTEMVKGKAVFERALRDCLRTVWAVPGSGREDDLQAALEELKGENGLCDLLWKVHTEPGLRHPQATDLASGAKQFDAAYQRGSVETELKQAGIKAGSGISSVVNGLDEMQTAAAAGEWDALRTRCAKAFNSDAMGWTAFRSFARDDTPAGRTALALMNLFDALPSPEGRAVDLFLEDVRQRAREIKDREALLDYDDMLSLVAEALTGDGGPLLVERLRSRYKAALIDEFQDTSSSQWQIFRTLFQADGWKLVLIGDPKQAIYGFRGGDIHTYTAAQASLLGAAEPVRLGLNYRSTRPMVEAYNRILDQTNDPPFFAGPVRYEVPVDPGREDLRWVDAAGADLPPVRLVRVPKDDLDQPVGRLRRKLARHLAREVSRLWRSGPRFLDPKAELPDAPLQPGDVFVLTNTKHESALMADALREAGVPAVFYKREGVFQSVEAVDFLNVLKAVADPSDPDRRAKAWLTPVFGAALADLEACRELPETHPALERLRGWHALAEERRFPDLFREMADGGLLRRLIRTEADDRSAGIWLQLSEFALQEAGARHGSFAAFVARFEDLVAGRSEPPGEDGDVHRTGTDRSAVQILTMHKAKGLEAKVVVLFGGLSDRNPGKVRHFCDGTRRRFWVGSKPSPELAQRAERELVQEAQRLLYVALTRAKAQLILPVWDGEGTFVGNRTFLQETGDPKGPYGLLNRRLRDLYGTPGFQVEDLTATAARGDAAVDEPASIAAVAPIPIPAMPDLRPLALRARPVRTSSFSSLSREIHEHGNPDPELHAAPEDGERDRLPGGAVTGTCLHAVIERAPLASAAEAGSLEAWMARADIGAILDATLAEAGLEPRHRNAVARLAFLALITRYDLPGGGVLEGLAPLQRTLREVDFLIRHPGSADFLDGSIDLLFEWEGRTYFVDWKSNSTLKDFSLATCADYTEEKYGLQFRIYTLAVCEFLGIAGESDFEARFGGGLYVYLRGLPEAGVIGRRPSWAEVEAWRQELAGRWVDHVSA